MLGARHDVGTDAGRIVGVSAPERIGQALHEIMRMGLARRREWNLADRYIASNLAHQGARVPAEERDEFIAWLKQLEYGVYGLPAEDLVLYLRVPAAEAHRLAGKRGPRDYTKLRREHDQDRHHGNGGG